jgi:membrane fusion protein, multidrug efflux system
MLRKYFQERSKRMELNSILKNWAMALVCLLCASIASCIITVTAGAEDVATISSGKKVAHPVNVEVRVLLISCKETILSSEISASVKQMLVDLGDRFRTGEKLITFDGASYRAELQKAESELERARKTVEVNRRLHGLNSISDLEVAVSEANMSAAKAEVLLRKIRLGKCAITAPFSGRVVKRHARPFEYVNPGSPLIEIIDDIHLEMQLFVTSSWLKWLKKGAPFEVFIDETKKKYSGTVSAMGSRVDPVSQTLEIRAVIQGMHSELLAGMSGTARFTIPNR